MRTPLLALLLSFCSLAFGELQPIPEASQLHPELYTIQFTLAHVSDDFEMTPPSFTNSSYIVNGKSFDPSKMTEEEIREHVNELMRKKQSGELPQRTDAQDYIKYQRTLIQKSNPTYSSFATVHVESGKEFSVNEGCIKGLLDLEANTVDNLKIKYKDYPPIELSAIAIDTRSWHTIGIGGRGEKFFILIKLYDPQK